MIKIDKINKEKDTALQSICRVVVEFKINRLLEVGLPDRWDKCLVDSVLRDEELQIEHDRIRGSSCNRDQLETTDPNHCKTPQQCDPCPVFDPGAYSIGWILGERGDILLYPSEQNRDEFDLLFDRLTDAVAIMAFVPGGVPGFWNYSYEAKFDGQTEA